MHNNWFTGRFAVNANAQNTLQHIQSKCSPPLRMPAGAHKVFLCVGADSAADSRYAN